MSDEKQSVELPPGQVIGECRILRRLARGGMGEIYLAHHLSLQKDVALKVLPPSKGTAEHIERFFREARICSRIEHPNVVPIYNVTADGGKHCIVMQYVEGKNLAEIVEAQQGALPWRPALKIFRLAAKGVGAVHRRGLIHRDIKPSNIMVSNESRVLLMDFGLVREESGAERTSTRTTAGTPAFMAPEQCLGRALDVRSDVFSLGSTLYFLLTGQVPYHGSMRWVLVQIGSGKQPKPVRELNPSVPAEVSNLVGKAMSFETEDRFADGDDMSRAIGRLLKELDQANSQPTASTEATLDTTESYLTPELVPLVSVIDESTTPLVETRDSAEVVVRERPLLDIPDSGTDSAEWQSPTRSRRGDSSGKLILGSALGLVVLVVLTIWILTNNATDQPPKGPPSPTPPVVRHPQSPALYQEIIEDRRIVAVILQTNGGKRRVDVTRMKRIPPGHVALGDRHGRLRTHLEQLPSLSGKPEVIDELLAEWQEPTQTTLGAYWIDRYEVTNAQYAEFLNATAHPAPEDWNGNEPPPGREEHPVVHIDQRSADAYAKWAGKQLPTADHWLRAFRDDTEQFYPWGNVFEPGRCNVAANPNQTGTSSVEATPEDVSPHNVFNLAGNVREYLRELSLDRFGNEVVECRGADWSSPGDLAAIGTYRSLFPADEAAQREVGFRCIVEVPRVR